MPIPKINLIPPGYYLRKKAKTAAIVAAVAVLAEVAALVALAVHLSGVNQQLNTERTEWSARQDQITKLNGDADAALASVKDLTAKTQFIDDTLKVKNPGWARVFESIARYTYPGAVYSSIKPTPGGTAVSMHVSLVGGKKISPIRLMTMYVGNLQRSPVVKAVLPSSFPVPENADGTGGSLTGGPPMPGGGPPMPGGPSMPGMPMPGGRYIGSAQSLAGPAVEGLNNYNAALGGSPMPMGQPGLPTDNSGGLTGVPVPKGPPLYGMDVAVELQNAIQVVNNQRGQ